MNCIKNIAAKKIELNDDIKKIIQLENKIKIAKKEVRILIKAPFSTLEETLALSEKIDQILIHLADLSINQKGKDSYKMAIAKEDTWNLLEKLDSFSIKKFQVSIW